MNKATKNIILVLFILALAGVLGGGLIWYVYSSQHPFEGIKRLAKKEVIEEPVDPETVPDEFAMLAGQNYEEEFNGDGTVTRTIYTNDIKYRTDDGDYETIDNTVKPSEGEYAFENTTNTAKTYFKADAQDETFIKFSVPGERSTWETTAEPVVEEITPDVTGESVSVVKEPAKVELVTQSYDRSAAFSFVNAAVAEPQTDGNIITYPDVYDGIDAKYTVFTGSLLEELVVEKRQPIDKISQQTAIEGVYYKEHDDGSITFHDIESKNLVFTSPRPVMYELEDRNEFSYGLHYEITESEDSTLLISKVIDEEGKIWLENAEYPVVIDNSYQVLGVSENLQGWVRNYNNSNYYSGNYMPANTTTGENRLFEASRGPFDTEYRRALLTFNTGTTPPVGEVIGGKLNVYMFGMSCYRSGYGREMNPFEEEDEGDDLAVYTAKDLWVSSDFDSGAEATLWNKTQSGAAGVTYEGDLDTTPYIDHFYDSGECNPVSYFEGTRFPQPPEPPLGHACTDICGTTPKDIIQYADCSGDKCLREFIIDNEASINFSGLGRTQFIFDSAAFPVTDGHTGVYIYGYGVSGLEPTLEIVYMPLPLIEVLTPSSNEYDQLRIEINDDTDDELYWELEYKYESSLGNWTEWINACTFNTNNSGDCGGGGLGTYNCSATTKEGTDGICTVTNTGLNSDTSHKYRARVYRSDVPSGYSLYSAEASDWTRAKRHDGVNFTVTTPRWDQFKIAGCPTNPNPNPSWTRFHIGFLGNWGSPLYGYRFVGVPSGGQAGVVDSNGQWSPVFSLIPAEGSKTLGSWINDVFFPSCIGTLTVQGSGEVNHLRPDRDHYIGEFSRDTRESSAEEFVHCPAGNCIDQNMVKIYTRARNPDAPEYIDNTDTTIQMRMEPIPPVNNEEYLRNPLTTQYAMQAKIAGTDWSTAEYCTDTGGSCALSNSDWGSAVGWNSTGDGHVFTGFVPNTCYTFRAKSKNSTGIEGEDESASIWSAATTSPCTDPVPPDAPTVACDYSEIDGYNCSVGINDPTNPVPTQYRIQYSNDNTWPGTTTEWVYDNDGGDMSEFFKPLDCDASKTTYYYRVQARHDPGSGFKQESEWSVVGSDTLPPCQPQNVRECTTPFVCSRGSAYIDWDWDEPAHAEAITKVALFDQRINQLYIDIVNPPPPYRQAGLNPNKQHSMRARACDRTSTTERCGAWSANSSDIYTYAANPTVTVLCDYDTKYYCDFTINEAVPQQNPVDTDYMIEYCLPDSGVNCSKNGSGWTNVLLSGAWIDKVWDNSKTFTYTKELSHWLQCSIDNTAQYYRVSVRNDAGEQPPLYLSPSDDDTLPPCAPENVRHDAPPTQTINFLKWRWDAPSGGEAVSSYLADTDTQLEATYDSTWFYHDQPGLSPNTNHTISVKARDNVRDGRTGKAAGASAYTSIEPVAGINFTNWGTETLSFKATPSSLDGQLNNGGQSGIYFQATTSPSYNSGWITDNSGTQSILGSNTEHCYEALTRNGDADTTNWGPVNCTYTHAHIPDRPALEHLTGGESVNLTLRTATDNNPGYTRYAICVTKVDEEISKYVLADADDDGTVYVDWGCSDPMCDNEADCIGTDTGQCSSTWDPNTPTCEEGYLDNVDIDVDKYWATRVDQVAGDEDWGDTNGIIIAGFSSSKKYDFRAKARNENTGGADAENWTNFGPVATLFLVKNNIVGWAWSSNIGWVSMNCLNMFIDPSHGYSCGVSKDWGLNAEFEPTRDINPLEGYAWSASGQALKGVWTEPELVSNSAATEAVTNVSTTFSDKNIATDSNGDPHIVWREKIGVIYNLYYQRWNGAQWVKANGESDRDNVSDTSNDDRFSSMVLDSNDYPHVAWKHYDSDGGYSIYYKKWNGTDWVDVKGSSGFENVDVTAAVNSGDGRHPSLQVDEAGNPHIVWEDMKVGEETLLYSQWDPIFDNEDGTFGAWVKADGITSGCDIVSLVLNLPNKQAHSLDIESGTGYPHVVWKDGAPSVGVYYTYWNGSAWSVIEDVNYGKSNPGSPDIVLDSNNNSHIVWAASELVFYIRKIDGFWKCVDGGDAAALEGNCRVLSGNVTGYNTSLLLDSNDMPHVTGHGNYDAAVQKYRHWDPYVNNGAGAWVTVSGDYGNGDNDLNLKAIDPGYRPAGVSMALGNNNAPHFIWFDPYDTQGVYYKYWGDYEVKSGLGWISLYTNVCSDNTQQGCYDDGDCVAGTCIESAGAPPEKITYGFCYNNSVPPVRHGKCLKDGTTDCTEGVTVCPGGDDDYCVLETCSCSECDNTKSGTCSDSVNDKCRAFGTANFSGITREIEGWTRILSLKEQGTKYDCDPITPGLQPCNDWGWTELGGDFDDGEGTTGTYKLSGTEVDSQLFLGDPDVNPNELALYSLIGWSWDAQIADFSSNSLWLNPTNASQTGMANEKSRSAMVIDDVGDPHIAWSEYDKTNDSYDIYYLKLKAGRWVTASGAVYQPGVINPVASHLNVTNIVGVDSIYPSLVLDSNNNPHIAWQLDGWDYEFGSIYYSEWDGVSGQWATSLIPTEVEGVTYYAQTPSLALDSNDNPHVAYRQNLSYMSYTGNAAIYYKKLDEGAWVSVTDDMNNFNVSNTQIVSPSTYLAVRHPSLKLDVDDNPHIVWQHEVDNTGKKIYYRWWDEVANGGLGAWVDADPSDGNDNDVSVNADIATILGIPVPEGADPIIALYSDGRPGIVWRDPDKILYRQWDGSNWVSVSGETDGTNLQLNANLNHGSYGGPASLLIDKDDQPHIAWGDMAVPEIYYRWWNGSNWVTADSNTASLFSTPHFNLSQTLDGRSKYSVVGLDQWGNPHVSWVETEYSDVICEADDECTNPNYPKCACTSEWGGSDWVRKCGAVDVAYSRWSPGRAQLGLGWMEFMPAGALMGIPWVETMYSDIYAAESIQLAPPPRGSGKYTATYLIMADGSIQGVSEVNPPTTAFYEEGFQPLIEEAGLPFGENALSMINVEALTTTVDGTRNRYGHEVDSHDDTGQSKVDISADFGTTSLGGKIYYYHGADQYTFDSEVTFPLGTAESGGNGLIVIDGNLEINANIFYEQGDLSSLGINAMPSVAFIVEGNINVNSMVDEISGVFVAKGDEGVISTSRVQLDPEAVSAPADDTYVSNNEGTYANNVNDPSLHFGYEPTLIPNRAFMRWQFGGGAEMAIPPGSEIRNAYIKLHDDGNSIGDDFTGRIYLLDYLDVFEFTSANWAPDALFNAPTSNSVGYDTTGWISDRENITPDIKSLVQKYINNDEYAKKYYGGQDLNFGVVIKEGATEHGNYKSFYSADSGLGDQAPELVIEYSPRRVRYPIAAGTDDTSSLSSSYDNAEACMQFGWNTVAGEPERLFLRFAGIGISPKAEVLEAHIRSTVCGTGSTKFQVRQGLLRDYPITFSNIPYDLPLDTDVSEVAQDIGDSEWANGDSIVMGDTASIVEAFIGRDESGSEYQPGVLGFSELSLRLRRGSDSVEESEGVNEYRSISQLQSKLEVDYLLPLQVNGLFVAKGYNFDRKYTRDLAPAEKILYDGRVVANTPPGLSDFTKALPLYMRVTP